MWSQALAAFAVWVAYAVLLQRRAHRLHETVRQSGRRAHVKALAWLLGSAGVALASLWAVAALGGIAGETLRPWAFGAALAAGLVFVHGQAVATGYYAYAALGMRTDGKPGASESQESP